jgi:hypothetical protein
MDQFFIAYDYTPTAEDHVVQQRLLRPVIEADDFPKIQSQADSIQLSTLVRSYISSLVVSLRLHPYVVSTSISSRTVEDIRNLVRVHHIRQSNPAKWTNAEYVPSALEACASFRIHIENGQEGVTVEQILRDVLESVRAPF